jgi:CRISPR-associated protein Cmr5
MQTRSQRYAKKVYGQVQVLLQHTREEQKQYGSMAHKLPVLIRTAGLSQALAYVDARGKEPHHHLLEHLATTLDMTKENLLKQSREAELSEYMHLTEQTITALLWYKRFAQSVLDVKAGDETEDK